MLNLHWQWLLPCQVQFLKHDNRSHMTTSYFHWELNIVCCSFDTIWYFSLKKNTHNYDCDWHYNVSAQYHKMQLEKANEKVSSRYRISPSKPIGLFGYPITYNTKSIQETGMQNSIKVDSAATAVDVRKQTRIVLINSLLFSFFQIL